MLLLYSTRIKVRETRMTGSIFAAILPVMSESTGTTPPNQPAPPMPMRKLVMIAVPFLIALGIVVHTAMQGYIKPEAVRPEADQPPPTQPSK